MKLKTHPFSINKSSHFTHIWNLTSYLFLLGLFLQLVGCSTDPDEILTKQNFDPEQLASFVEPEFPFITTSVDARELGAGFPGDNITPRCLALRLGSEAYACFDTDMLRWSVAWTGDYLPMVTMGQISYRDFHNKDNEIPTIAGNPKIATGLYPGWMGADPEFSDPRPSAPNPEGPSWGPLPLDAGRWNGIYVNGQEVVLSYTAQHTDIYEKPGIVTSGEVTAFTRTFQVEHTEQVLSLVAAEVSDGVRSEVSGNSALIFHGSAADTITAIGLAGEVTGVELNVSSDRYATVEVSPSAERLKFTVVLLKGPAGQLEAFKKKN